MTGKRKDPLVEFAEIQKRMQKSLKPFADMQEQIRRIAVPVFDMSGFEAAIKSIVDSQRSFAKAVESLQLGPLGEFAKKLAQIGRDTKALDAAGWLPHYTTPFEYVEQCNGDIDALKTRLSDYYRQNWQGVRKDIEARIAGYDIDGEAKATFAEALSAHEAGLYRCVCRVLLPEIERVARIELHAGKMAGITSQPLLKKLAGELTPAAVEPRGYYGLILFQRLTEHLYEQVNDEAARKRFAQDAVPNRHAAVHGLVSYSSPQNSLNTIFMADYIFQVISFLKNPAP